MYTWSFTRFARPLVSWSTGYSMSESNRPNIHFSQGRKYTRNLDGRVIPWATLSQELARLVAAKEVAVSTPGPRCILSSSSVFLAAVDTGIASRSWGEAEQRQEYGADIGKGTRHRGHPTLRE